MAAIKTILVTGANGFVGSHLTRELLAAGHHVRITSRTPPNDVRCEPGVSCVQVPSIDAITDWDAALQGIDCVIHLAARVHVMRPSLDDRCSFHATNVLGTRTLAAAASERGVKRFVFLSSIKVNGEATYANPYTATDLGAPVDDYGNSKFQAEQALLEIVRKSSMEVGVIRPPLVYGPGVRANFLRLLSWVHKGIPLPFGAVRNKRSLVNIWNLCDLIKCVVEAPTLSSSIFMVSDGDDLSTPELIRKLAAAMGRLPLLLSVPSNVLGVVGVLTGKSAEVARLCGSLEVDIAATKRQFGWAPPVSVDEGIARTVRWYLDEVGAHRG